MRGRARPRWNGLIAYKRMSTSYDALRPRTSPRPPRPTSRTYPRAARIKGLDSTLDGAKTRTTARNRACDAPQQLTSETGIGSGGFVAPIRSHMTSR